jgi:hypothetical protein
MVGSEVPPLRTTTFGGGQLTGVALTGASAGAGLESALLPAAVPVAGLAAGVLTQLELATFFLCLRRFGTTGFAVVEVAEGVCVDGEVVGGGVGDGEGFCGSDDDGEDA